jgi:hypothetical protein
MCPPDVSMRASIAQLRQFMAEQAELWATSESSIWKRGQLVVQFV